MNSNTSNYINDSITAIDLAIKSKYKSLEDSKNRIRLVEKSLSDLQNNLAEQNKEIDMLQLQKTKLRETQMLDAKLEHNEERVII